MFYVLFVVLIASCLYCAIKDIVNNTVHNAIRPIPRIVTMSLAHPDTDTKFKVLHVINYLHQNSVKNT